MTWFKVDDKLPDHRKIRALRKSHQSKRRDVGPIGIWALAGAWSTDGYVPLEWLEEYDDEAEAHAARLVEAGLFHPTTREGERGYVFHDWHDQNPAKDDNDPSSSGTFGNHVRWHVQRQLVEPTCRHCPTEPDESSADDRPDIAPMIAPDIGVRRAESLPSRPVPSPIHPRPDPDPTLLADQSADAAPSRFEEFWDVYAYKLKRVDADKAWVKAVRKVDPDRIIAAAAGYVAHIRADQEARGERATSQAYPASWLNGERWLDERKGLPRPQTNVQAHMALVRQLGEEEPLPLPQVGQRR